MKKALQTTSRKLHLGCGPGPQPSDWINVDGSWNAWIAKRPRLRGLCGALKLAPGVTFQMSWDPNVMVIDVTHGLPFPDRYLSAIYSSHMVEHLYFDQAQRVLAECHRILESGGVLRVVVPDLHAAVLEYLAASNGDGGSQGNAVSAADALNERLMFTPRHAPTGGLAFRMYNKLKDFHSHKWMYDADSLIAQFTKAGFAGARQMAVHDSRIPGIEMLEQPGRVEDGGLCVEGIKP